jgi:Zn ribbon nucleic-acid-binding protein
MIRFRCPACGQAYNVRDESAGKVRTCVKCGEPMRVPQPESVEIPLDPEEPPAAAKAEKGRPAAEKPAPQVVYHVIREQKEKKSKGKGISLGKLALVFAIVALCVPVVGLVGFILGLCGLVQGKDSGTALLGMILSLLFTGAGAIFWFTVMVSQ